jgi:hypothetical protein
MGSGTYIPIDVHENPYNNGKPQPEDMPSQSTHLNNQQNAVRAENTHGVRAVYRTTTRPTGTPWGTAWNTSNLSINSNSRNTASREDMPSNTVEYMNDEQIHAIPGKN